VGRQMGTEAPPVPDVDPASLVRFSNSVPTKLSVAERESLAERARQLDPWLQGPFLLGGDLVVGGAWRVDQRWVDLGREVPEDLSGKRILDIGSNAGYDPFMFRLLGADYVLGCEPYEFFYQAEFLESIYRTGVDFKKIGWQQLSPAEHGRFDLVHCHGILYHEPTPLLLLQKLREMLADGGEMVLGTMMLADPELSEMTRFVPGSFNGDPTWWTVPGRLATRWMLEATGFEVVSEFSVAPGPAGEFEVMQGYFRTVGMDPSPLLEPPPKE